jgi:O-antigen/teichoic acid export membrane protein
LFKKVYTLLLNLFGFGKGHERSNLAKRNIGALVIIRGLNIGIGLLLIPLIIRYLGASRYGIWITLSSIIGWFGFFDIGLGNGLRNKLTEALVLEKKELARVYVSTTYAILSIIIGIVVIVFYIVNPFINWTVILNANENLIPKGELSLLALIVFTFFSIQFVLKLITTVLTSDQMPAKASIFDLLGKILSLSLIFFLTRTTKGSLLYLGIIMSSTPIFVLVLSSLWFYNTKYRSIKPSWKFVQFNKAKDLFNLGAKFFIIQIAVILLYQTDTIIISQLFGPEQVTPYNIAFQYFSVLMMGFSILISPFWSAFTEAWTIRDMDWIKKIMRKLSTVWKVVFIASIVMLVFSKNIYRVWIGDSVSISYSMSALVGIWILINIWNSIFSQFLNGVGRLKLQLYLGIFAAVLNIPLSIFLGKNIGILGVILASIIVGVAGALLYPLQYKKIIEKTAKGIWNQ